MTDGKTQVLIEKDQIPVLSVHDFGKGKGIYLASFQFSDANTRLLYQLIRYAGGEGATGMYMTDNCYTECAYYPESKTLVVINNSEETQTTRVETHAGVKELTLDAFATVFINL